MNSRFGGKGAWILERVSPEFRERNMYSELTRFQTQVRELP